MEIYLIRHTQVLGNKSICYGQSNPALASTFLKEVAILKTKLPTNFDQVYASTLVRCTYLAKELGYNNVKLDNALMEVNFGEWEGKPWAEIPSKELNPWMADFVNIAPPQGESLAEMHIRVCQFIEKLRLQPHKKILIITHAGVIRNIFSHFLNIPLNQIFKISIEYGEVFKIKLAKEAEMDKVFFTNVL